MRFSAVELTIKWIHFVLRFPKSVICCRSRPITLIGTQNEITITFMSFGFGCGSSSRSVDSHDSINFNYYDWKPSTAQNTRTHTSNRIIHTLISHFVQRNEMRKEKNQIEIRKWLPLLFDVTCHTLSLYLYLLHEARTSSQYAYVPIDMVHIDMRVPSAFSILTSFVSSACSPAHTQ